MSDTSYVVFSGGSACNSLVNAFQTITSKVSYILAISDNGGSTSELLRVLGGPSIGDLRSRLIHLINTEDSEERIAIKELLNYRLSEGLDENIVRDEWTEIVEGRHGLWDNIAIEKKETIRGFLVLFNFEILKRAHKHFNFRNGSVGNFFLTGARVFFSSLEAAIFLFASITAIREPTYVLPVINTNQTASIAALLENNEILHGQCEISHPQRKKQKDMLYHLNPIDAFSKLALPSSPMLTIDESENENLVFDKSTIDQLPAPIKRIYYMNEYGQEIYPLPNPKILDHLMISSDVVYSIGSLYSSILPCLILRKVGYAIAHSGSLKRKILVLNGINDRETYNHTAIDFIVAITNALNESQLIDARRAFYDELHSPTDLAKPVDCTSSFRKWSSRPSTSPPNHIGTKRLGKSKSFRMAQQEGYHNKIADPIAPFPPELVPAFPPSTYITHLIYLTNSCKFLKRQLIRGLYIHCFPFFF
ncbi:UPF0052-domain-containing protein [Backusella circina FSU 941]|nr:UPF0052-domain-containing protein [Backusella circina FSU 941]